MLLIVDKPTNKEGKERTKTMIMLQGEVLF